MREGERTENWWEPFLQFAAVSDIGMRRTNNQDSHREVPAATSRLWRSRGHLFVVADGMGAHAAGELASQIATETIAQSYLKRTGQSPYDAVRDAIYDAHRQIRRQGEAEPAFRDMGTTADALLLLPEGAVIGHVGDSRVYRLRGKNFEQLTFDHSLVWEITKSGRKIDGRVPDHIPKNVITRSLGPTQNLTVDREGPLPILPGDTYLLCSDGLSGQMTDSETAQVLALFSPEEAARSLVNLTNLRGGPDNITMIIVRVLDNPEPEDEKPQEEYEKRPSLTSSGWGILTAALAAWLLVPILGLAGGGLLWTGIFTAAALALTGFTLFHGRKTFFNPVSRREIPQPFGKGPYTAVSAEATDALTR